MKACFFFNKREAPNLYISKKLAALSFKTINFTKVGQPIWSRKGKDQNIKRSVDWVVKVDRPDKSREAEVEKPNNLVDQVSKVVDQDYSLDTVHGHYALVLFMSTTHRFEKFAL